MTQPEFLEAEIMLLLHDEALCNYGGLAGIRDQSLLETALARPRNKLTYADPFNGSNKGTAWAARVLFLRLNGDTVGLDKGAVSEKLPLLASSQIDEPSFAAWLRTNQRPPPQEPAR